MDLDILQQADPRQLGKRLQQARAARNFTQQQAADHIDVARTTITAMEKGDRRVQPDDLIRLADFYGRSIGELLRRSEPVEAFNVQLRAVLAPSASSEPNLIEDIGELQRLCEDYLELERICDAPLPRRYPAQYQVGRLAPRLAAEDLAVAERNRLGLGDGPILNLREVLENDVGLRIFYVELPSKVSAMFAYAEQLGGCIAINRKHPADRKRMSLAHEYAHFLTNRYVTEVLLISGYHREPEQEKFANAFASAFLMPAAGLSRRFNELRQNRGGRLTNADLVALAHLYFVSFEALVLRLEELRRVPAGYWERLKQSGFKVRTAQELLQIPEHPGEGDMLPVRYQALAVRAFEQESISEGRLARYLRTERLEARRIAQELSSISFISDEGTLAEADLDLSVEVPERGS